MDSTKRGAGDPCWYLSRASAATGRNGVADDLARLGEDTLRLKHEFKPRRGFGLESVGIPRRISETPTPVGVLDEDFLQQALKVYQQGVLPHTAAA